RVPGSETGTQWSSRGGITADERNADERDADERDGDPRRSAAGRPVARRKPADGRPRHPRADRGAGSPAPEPRGEGAGVRAAPRRLKPSTETTIARPGMVATWGATRRTSRPVDTMRPHEGVGGCTPSPRNDSAASTRTAFAMKSVA